MVSQRYFSVISSGLSEAVLTGEERVTGWFVAEICIPPPPLDEFG